MRHIIIKQIQLGGYEVTCLACGEKNPPPQQEKDQQMGQQA